MSTTEQEHSGTTTATTTATTPSGAAEPSQILLPRITIQFCTQCKWMLRAAYYAQELISTFSTSLGEVALQPSSGGKFVVTIVTAAPTQSSPSSTAPAPAPAPAACFIATSGPRGAGHETIAAGAAVAKKTTIATLLWDRSLDGGFPETKELKRRVRDVIDPSRNLGHVDRGVTGN